MKPQRKDCRFFESFASECRRSSPSVHGWPSVRSPQWCGEYEAHFAQPLPSVEMRETSAVPAWAKERV